VEVQPDRGWAEAEPGPELAYIKRHGGQPEGTVEVGQFSLSFRQLSQPRPHFPVPIPFINREAFPCQPSILELLRHSPSLGPPNCTLYDHLHRIPGFCTRRKLVFGSWRCIELQFIPVHVLHDRFVARSGTAVERQGYGLHVRAHLGEVLVDFVPGVAVGADDAKG
jgi:hypothetical protein